MKKGNLRLLIKSYRLIENIRPGTIFVQFISSLFSALRPFINIYFPAKIIWILSNTKSVPDLVLNVAISVSLNLILTVLGSYFSQQMSIRQQQVYQEEHNRISQKVYTVDYPFLEDAEFEALVNRYRERGGSPFQDLIGNIGAWTSGLTGLGASIWMLWPFFQTMFQRTGEGFMQSPWISAVFIAAIVVAAVFVVLLSASMNKKFHQHSNEYYGILRIFYYYSEVLSDYNSGKEVRLFEEEDLIENHATERFRSDSLRVWSKLGTYQATASACLALIGAFLGFGIYSIIALKASAGLFAVDQLVKFVGSFLQIITAVISISSTMGKMSGIAPKLREYYEILDKQNKGQGSLLPEPPKSISLKNVCFQYPNTEKFALKNVSIDIPMGERIAIVGENGSGKTTFIKLLCGLYDISDGEIELNGRNIKEFNIESYYRLFSVIFQDFKIFSLSLAENVACSTEYDAALISEVLEKVGFNQRSEKMKNGIESMLYRDCDPDGIEISGGEAQKLALARALYKDAPIVILDEPTAALDPFAEQALYQKFDSLVGDRAVFYISHRLSSCFFCNKIAVFDQGELVQFGTHQELISNPNGKYHELWMAQAQYYV
jgi:ATP-binding cassette subfamily B protein